MAGTNTTNLSSGAALVTNCMMTRCLPVLFPALMTHCCTVFSRRSKSKKSEKDALSASAAVNAGNASMERTPAQLSATDPLPSGQSLLLPLKQEPCYESNIVADSGM